MEGAAANAMELDWTESGGGVLAHGFLYLSDCDSLFLTGQLTSNYQPIMETQLFDKNTVPPTDPAVT